MARRLFIDGTEFGQWASSRDLQNAANTYTTANTFVVHLSLHRADTGSALPFMPVGGSIVYYVDYDAVTPANTRLLFAGEVKDIAGTDPRENVHGEITLTCAPPIQRLNHVMEYVAFNPTDYPDDRSRVLRLGVLAASIYTDWDWTSGISATPSVTYPSPPVGEALTEYEYKTVADILNDLATDPGRPGDTGYPVPTRHWWLGARLQDPAHLDWGVLWMLNYVGANDVPAAALELKDRKADALDTAVIYDSGATWRTDYRNVIQRIEIAGPRTDPVLCTWQSLTNVTAGHGHITKYSGTEATWDAGAVSKQRFKGGDWEATAIVQEFYLAHDTFQVDDGPRLFRATATGQFWIDLFETGDTVFNTLGTRSWHAAPRYPVGIAASVLDCHAATCILRSHFSTNKQGMGLIFRCTDADDFWRVENTGGDYALIKREGGSETTVGTLGVTPADGHEIKVFALGSQIQVYVDNTLDLQVTGETFNQAATRHGLYLNCDADTDSRLGRFYDFQCTTFFSDDAFGIGTETSVTSWTDISYGFIKNNNGTLTMNEGGVTVATSDYSYNDVLRVATMMYFDYNSASFNRMVRWEKLPSGAAEWVTLHERTTGVVALDDTHPWYVQFAGSDLGATLNNISLRKQYSNMFHADPAVFGTLSGDYPANGLLQSDDLDTFVKRQTRADAIFRQSALPRVSLQCRIPPTAGAPPFSLGDSVLVTNHQANWLDDGVTDTRQTLVVTSVQRIETPGEPLRPQYALTLESQYYDTDLSGQRHLLKGSVRTSKPASRGVPTQSATDNTVFEWPDPTGDQSYGTSMEVQLARIDAGAYANAQIPVQRIAPDATALQLDKGSLVPGAQYVIRSRNVSNSGLASDWTESAAFVAPSQAPYSRPYALQFYVDGQGSAITPGAYEAIPVPESGTIVAWELVSTDSTGLPAPGAVQLDVQHAGADAFKQSGAAAFASIAGVDLPTLGAVDPEETNDSANLSSWSTALKAGDKLRFIVLGPDTDPVGVTPTVKILTANLIISRGDPS